MTDAGLLTGVCAQIKTNGIKGHSTYHLIVDASKCTFCHGIYAMAGTSEGVRTAPPAEARPVG